MASLPVRALRLATLITLWPLIQLSLVLGAPETPSPVEFTVDSRNVTLRGVRYANPGKPPIVLYHGLVENSRIWREIGSRLHEMGYDVWMPNFRGHGRGKHRSTVKNYVKGLYSFEHMVTDDVPLVIEHVFVKTGQAPHLAGHSMGGMAIKEYAAGVHRTEHGTLAASDALARARARGRIKSLAFLGSPPHMRNLPQTTRAAGLAAKQVTKSLRADVPMVGLERAPTEPDPTGLLPWVRNKALSAVDPVLPYVIPQGVLDARNLTRAELAALREKGVSSPHTDILDDFAYWTKSKSFVARDGYSWEGRKRIYARSLYVAGEHDSLARASDMAAEARLLPSEAEPRLVTVIETSHVDLISGKHGSDRVSPVLGDWFERPESLGAPLSESRVGQCSVRKRLVDILTLNSR